MPYLGVLGINFEKLFLFMKSALSNLSYCKFWCKNKNSLILDQKYVACVFLDKNFKKPLSYLNSDSLGLSKMSL